MKKKTAQPASSPPSLDVMDVCALAAMLCIKPASVHHRLYRKPDSLPAPFQRGKGGRLVWLVSDVMAWIKSERKTS